MAFPNTISPSFQSTNLVHLSLKAISRKSNMTEPQGCSPSLKSASSVEDMDTSSPAEDMDTMDTSPDLSQPKNFIHSFEELKLQPEIFTIISKMRFNVPTIIQMKSLPALLGDPPLNVLVRPDILVQSRSETGKTTALILTILSRVDVSKNWPQIIYLTPTYDLAVQAGRVLTEMLPEITLAYASREERVDDRVKKEHIILGTSEVVYQWILANKVNPKKLIMFVVDDVHIMITQKQQLEATIKIRMASLDSCQKVLSSATYTNQVQEFTHKVAPKPWCIWGEIEQLDLTCQDHIECFTTINDIISANSTKNVIILCDGITTAKILEIEMDWHGHSVALHRDLNRFCKGRYKILISIFQHVQIIYLAPLPEPFIMVMVNISSTTHCDTLDRLRSGRRIYNIHLQQ